MSDTTNAGAAAAYRDLQQRQEAIHEAWMEQVEYAKSLGYDHTRFNSWGPVLTKRGALRQTGLLDGQRAVELTAEPFTTEVTVDTESWWRE